MDVWNVLILFCIALLALPLSANGHHKKVIIHVPYKVHHHHHKHTIVKHIHHKHKDHDDGGDHYEVLGYTYGEPKAAPHEAYHAADESHLGEQEAPVSFDGAQYGSVAADLEDVQGVFDGIGDEFKPEHGFQ